MKQTDEALAKLIEKGIELASKTGEFVIEQAPDLLKEFYAWRIYANIFGLILGILILIIGRYLPYLWMNKKNEDSYSDESFFKRYGPCNIAAYVIFIICLFFGFILIGCSIYELIFIFTAPKLYLIEYFVI